MFLSVGLHFPFCACRHFCYECDIQISLKNDGEYLFLSKYLLALPDKAVEELVLSNLSSACISLLAREIALNHEEFCVFMDMILMQDRHILLFFFMGKDCFLECRFQSVLLLHRFVDQVT